MEFTKLEYIVKIAEVGNITKAAEELYMTQPALSHFISRTEKEEGVSLFDRSSSPITMTYEGKKYLQTARRILELNRQLQEEMEEISSGRKGLVRIGIPPLRAAGMLPRFLPAFLEEYPDVQVQTLEHNSRQLRKDVESGRVDFAVLPLLSGFEDFDCYPVCREELFLTARKGALPEDAIAIDEHGRKNADFKKLRQEPFILLKEGHGSRAAMDTIFELNGYKPRIFMETTNNETAFGLAAAGLGLAVIPMSTIETIAHKDDVEILHLSEAGYFWDIAIICRKNSYMSLLTKACIGIMKDVFADAD